MATLPPAAMLALLEAVLGSAPEEVKAKACNNPHCPVHGANEPMPGPADTVAIGYLTDQQKSIADSIETNQKKLAGVVTEIEALVKRAEKLERSIERGEDHLRRAVFDTFKTEMSFGIAHDNKTILVSRKTAMKHGFQQLYRG